VRIASGTRAAPQITCDGISLFFTFLFEGNCRDRLFLPLIAGNRTFPSRVKSSRFLVVGEHAPRLGLSSKVALCGSLTACTALMISRLERFLR